MADVTRPAGRSRAGLALVLGALSAFAPISVDLYLPAFPALARHFETSLGSVQLSLSTYLLGLALGQVLWGWLADRYGRRRPLVAGISLYVVASLACAFAPSVHALIGLRLLQGLGGCAGVVVARAIVRDLFAGAEAARFFALLILVFGVAPVLAPLIGGQILAAGGWRWIFLTLAVYGAACLASVSWLPETLPFERRRQGGLRDALAAYRQVSLHRSFIAYAAVFSLGSAALLAYISSSPAVLIEEHGVSPQAFGFVFGANALGLVAVSQITGRIVGRVGSERVLWFGVGAQTTAAATLALVSVAGAGGLAAVLPPMFVIVASLGAIMPTSTALALTPFPHAAGAASAVLGTAQTATGAASAALVGAVALDPTIAMGLVATGACLLALCMLVLVAPRRSEDLAAQRAPLA